MIDAVSASFADASRWRALEMAFWLLPIAAFFVFPRHYLLLNEIAILGLFALSLDLVLGYAGIVSLGHAAFFGFGAYGAALFAKHIHADPVLGLAVAIAAAGALGLVTSVLVLRGSDLTRLMVTLGVALILFEIANRLNWLTGGADGLQGVVMKPLLGAFEFDLGGRTACLYSLAVLFAFFLLARRVVHAPFGLSLQALRDNRLRASAVGIPVNFRLTVIYAVAAAMAGAAGALLAQTTGFASLDVLAFHRSAEVLLVLVIGGAGYLYGGLIGAALFALMHDGISALTPQYWQFWIGLILVLIVLIGRARLVRPWTWLAAARGAKPMARTR
jgi:branched-chain amino acid transport system permease protein